MKSFHEACYTKNKAQNNNSNVKTFMVQAAGVISVLKLAQSPKTVGSTEIEN
jgi:hypothetical protein